MSKNYIPRRIRAKIKEERWRREYKKSLYFYGSFMAALFLTAGVFLVYYSGQKETQAHLLQNVSPTEKIFPTTSSNTASNKTKSQKALAATHQIDKKTSASDFGIDEKSLENRTQASAASFPEPDEFNIYLNFDDPLGNSSVVTDYEGNVVEVTDYKPYGETNVHVQFDEQGEEILDSEESVTPYSYNDKEKDPETDLNYYGARYYNAATGKFTSQDPALFSEEYLEKSLEDPQRLNTYAYARNNPVMFIDEDGKSPVGYIFWGLGARWLESKGYYISAYFLEYARSFWPSFSSEKAPLNFNSNTQVAQTIQKSEKFQNEYEKIKTRIARGDLTGEGDIRLNLSKNQDLVYSFGKVNYKYEAVEKEKNQYNIIVTVEDTYNFDEFRVDNWLYDLAEELDLGDVANDMGRISQLIKELKTFEITVNIQENGVHIDTLPRPKGKATLQQNK